MQTTTLLYIVLAFLLSISVAFFQYFYKNKEKEKINILLFSLRTFSLFLLILLFINPTIEKREIENKKPILSVLVDNSQSTTYFKQENTVKELLQKINNNKELQEKFEVKLFSFGSSLAVLDSLRFDAAQTNISNAIHSVNELHKESQSPVLLVTDGNQTIGNDYEFINSKQKIFPITIGDTTQFKDVRISQVNVNKYSYIKNKFPVETLLFYEGKEKVTTLFSIYNNKKMIFSKKVSFSPNNKSQTILANLQASKEGQNYFRASISKLTDEKNTKNNTKNFSVEVIDEQTKVLILTSVLHPDLGALKKAIESNKQRAVAVLTIEKYKNQINDYQLVVLYQPTAKFNRIITTLKEQNLNFLMVSGANTNWNFINKQQLGFSKKAIQKTENYNAKYNLGFLTFLQKDIGFNQFSPLKDNYGEVILTKPHQILLFQSIQGIETKQPLLATFEQNNQKWGVLFGEGIWKWRTASFINSNSFQDFDEFIGNLTQYLASNKKRNRLEVQAENLYPSNSTINIAAFYTDKNFKFDDRASIELSLTNTETKKVQKLPFSLINNSYQVAIENLIGGNYTYKVTVVGQNISKYGKFKVTDYKIEEQFTNANQQKLTKLANRTGGKPYLSDDIDKALENLVVDKAFYTLQSSKLKEENLIDWKWILFFIISLLSVEWFVRKYYGKV